MKRKDIIKITVSYSKKFMTAESRLSTVKNLINQYEKLMNAWLTRILDEDNIELLNTSYRRAKVLANKMYRLAEIMAGTTNAYIGRRQLNNFISYYNHIENIFSGSMYYDFGVEDDEDIQKLYNESAVIIRTVA